VGAVPQRRVYKRASEQNGVGVAIRAVISAPRALVLSDVARHQVDGAATPHRSRASSQETDTMEDASERSSILSQWERIDSPRGRTVGRSWS